MDDYRCLPGNQVQTKKKKKDMDAMRHPTVKCGFIFCVPCVENRITHLQLMLHLMQCVLEWGGEQMAMDLYKQSN
jgi:hypothetical protein